MIGLVHQKIIKHFRKTKFNEELEKCFEEINCLERQLSDDKYLILKFFLHISKKEQEDRFKKIQTKGIPLIIDEYERKNETERDFIHEYNEYLPIVEKVLEKTDMPYAPWTIVEANDRNFSTLKIITTATQTIETYIKKVTSTLGQKTIKYLDREISKLPELSASVLDKLDLSQTISSKEYKKSKKLYQKKLETLQYELLKKKLHDYSI